MQIVISVGLSLLAALVLVPIGMFCLEVLVSLIPTRRKSFSERDCANSPELAVLIPAHNEQLVLGATLARLVPTLGPTDRVLVVADNCSDKTAETARQYGVDVIERTDRDRRGKGYALDHGLKHLAATPPAVVLFLDADCQVGEDTVHLLGNAAFHTNRPVQGLHLIESPPASGPLQIVAGLAFRFKNLVRAIGLSRLAGTCHLTGSGIALPWSCVAKSQLASGNVVEDMQWGIDLTLAGSSPIFLPEARVTSPFPLQPTAVNTQRTRWEHGHLQTLFSQVPQLLLEAVLQARISLLILALDLAIPPLSLLMLTWLLALSLCTVGAICGTNPWPALLLGSAGVVLFLAILAGWYAHCREQIPLVTLLRAPIYMLGKLPIYVSFLGGQRSAWVRTERDPQPAK